jgi:hypothetical protein
MWMPSIQKVVRFVPNNRSAIARQLMFKMPRSSTRSASLKGHGIITSTFSKLARSADYECRIPLQVDGLNRCRFLAGLKQAEGPDTHRAYRYRRAGHNILYRRPRQRKAYKGEAGLHYFLALKMFT